MPSRAVKKKKRRGNCYVTCEALYHLLGGKKARLVPHTLRHEGDTHWYLVLKQPTMFLGNKPVEFMELIIDPTASQFKTRPQYGNGRGTGFLTKKPSKRAREMMKRMVWQ